MTEPKVVHEWEVNGARLRVVIDGRVYLEELDPQFGWCNNDYVDDDLADELARLAARVKELEILLSADFFCGDDRRQRRPRRLW